MHKLPTQNPILAQFISGSPDLRYLASAFVATLNDKHDPRLTFIAAPTVNSKTAEHLCTKVSVWR